MMKNTLAIILGFALLFASGAPLAQGDRPRTQRTMVENSAPDFSAKDLDGNTVTLDQFLGKKIVIMEFWATWCGPCRYTMPQIHNIREKFKDKAVEVLSVNQQEDSKKVENFMKSRGMKMRVLLDSDATISRAYGVYGLPTIFVMDKAGVTRAKVVGYRADLESAMETFLNQLLAEKPPEKPKEGEKK